MSVHEYARRERVDLAGFRTWLRSSQSGDFLSECIWDAVADVAAVARDFGFNLDYAPDRRSFGREINAAIEEGF